MLLFDDEAKIKRRNHAYTLRMDSGDRVLGFDVGV